jgi:hypothetical protein
MVMPFNRKPTGRSETDVPEVVDFDALWDRVFMPVLTDAGYQPVRADQDIGGLIIAEMIQRLTVADLVVADVTLPNANVYYEIGIRHAARRNGCVLTAASWARPVFDLAQVRQVRFPLDDGEIGDTAAAAARAAIGKHLPVLAIGDSPVFASVPGFPDDVDESKLSAFRDLVDELSNFHADVSALALVPQGDRRRRVEEIVARYGDSKVVRETVVMRLIRLLRDYVGWRALLDYIATLPLHIARHPSVVEQRCLALAKESDPALAAGQLQVLIDREGGSSERYGLLGGRYKQLADAAEGGQQRRFLQLAIDSYELGMTADLNDYYPVSNLPRLYRQRGDDGDEQRAADAEVVAIAACQRAIRLGRADEWTRPTLLGAAFDRHDVATILQLASEVEREGAPAWKLASTLGDLRKAAAQCRADDVRVELEAIVERLARLVDESSDA